MTGPYGMTSAAVPARMIAGAALLALGGGLLLVAAGLFATGRVTGFDPAILLWTRGHTGDHGWLIAISRVVTVMGNNVTLWIAAAVAIGWCAIRRCWPWCFYLGGTTAGGAIIISAIKAAVGRPRPMVVAHLVDVQTASFPSGHAMDSAVVYGSLAIAMAAGVGGGRRGSLVVFAAMVLVFAIGASRIVLGVHWPTDVAAGWALGLSWTALFTRFYAAAVGPGMKARGLQSVRG